MTDFDRAYRENAELVYRYVFSLTRNADLAEEVTQQTFYEAIRHPENYRGEAALSTYLCGIAGNLMKKELSRRARENHVSIEEMMDLPGEGSAEGCGNGESEPAEAVPPYPRPAGKRPGRWCISDFPGNCPFRRSGRS